MYLAEMDAWELEGKAINVRDGFEVGVPIYGQDAFFNLGARPQIRLPQV